MKILYLTDQLYLHGGIEKVLTEKVNYLADIAGDDVTVLTYRQQGQAPVYSLSPKIRLLDLHVNYEINKSYFSPINLLKMPAHIWVLVQIIKEMQPEVIVSCSFGPDFYFLPFVCSKTPVIKEFHASRYFSFQSPSSGKARMLDKLSTWIEKKYTQLVVLNPDEVPFYHSDHISVIPNPAEITEVRAGLENRKMLAAGRISPVKNFADLIEAFSRLNARFPDWELHIWGEDYVGTRGKLQEQIDGLGLEKNIRFMGVTPSLQHEMQNYSIYAMTSETECFPMVLLEALSVGLPVISCDAPTGPRHIITDGEDGIVVPYKNLDIFTQKLEQLMTDENLRQKMGAKGRENVQRFAIDKVMQQWRTLFAQVIAERNPLPQPQP
ncbi:glycosyltransferase family 4 protein [Kaistella pullorum]|uniref:Glycosyltransferase family 4 protein n=1 Tax=Kaistella pullorum TaxID=2763074 RepID=A0ABR8WIV5_9FLAO|nr:glycosyltransferase family 4 protein [Kaistella pullorum]MBD8016994.1 glycosyltransferase family 4 protein [Kaistella pullorum]